MPKGNISLIMLFVLAIGSIIGLMSTNFLQSMIRETSNMRTSYQSYYLAKAGIELWTVAVKRYDYGFEDTITGWSSIFKDNLLMCTSGCIIEMTISSRFTGWVIGFTPEPIANGQCTPENAIIIPACSSQILPLFLDNRKLSNENSSYTNILKDYDMSLRSLFSENPTLWIGLVLSAEDRSVYDTHDSIITSTNPPKLFVAWNLSDMASSSVITPAITNILDDNTIPFTHFNYLTITNTNTSDSLSLCLNFGDNSKWYALDTTIITSKASFKNSSLSLKWIIKEELAGYVIDNCYDSQAWWTAPLSSQLQQL